MEARDGRGSHDAMRRDAERVRDETSGIGPGPSGCRDGVGTGVERVITRIKGDFGLVDCLSEFDE